MANEISVSAIIIEQEDGSYKANCPDLGINAQGASADDALKNLRDGVTEHIKKVGPDRLQLSPVKCLKLKVQV